MQTFQWLLPVLVTPLMKGLAWNVCWGTQAKTGHFCSLFFGNSLTYLMKDAFDWPYSGIRIRKIFVANLLDKCTVIFGPLKRCIHRDIFFQADFWILQCNEKQNKWFLELIPFSLKSFQIYTNTPFCARGSLAVEGFVSQCWVKLVTTLTKE